MSRLIDADELKKRFEKAQSYIQDGECAEAFYAHGNNLSTEWDCVEDIVDSMPTIEEVKGKWIDEGWYADGHSEHAFHCSVCGEHIIDYVCQVYDENPHCKWCGAEMVEEGAEE